MGIIETILLIVIASCSGYYVYYSTFKKKGCGCGKENCCTKKEPEESQ